MKVCVLHMVRSPNSTRKQEGIRANISDQSIGGENGRESEGSFLEE